MPLPDHGGDREFQKFKDATAVPGQPGVVVLNPDGTSLAAGGGTSMLDDSAFTPGGSSVTPAGFLGDDVAPDPIDEGDIGAARMRRTTRAQYVELVDTVGDSMADDANNALRVNVVAGAGGGVAQADESAFTEGTTQFNPVGGVLNDTITSDPTEDQAAAVRITPKRAIHVNLRDQTGAEVSVGGGTQYDEDTPAVAAEKLTMAGVVRKDTAASMVDLDGDRTELQVDGTGLLRARVDAALPAGANNIGDVDVLSIAAGANRIGKVTIRNPADTLDLGDATNPVRTDPTGTTTQPVSATDLDIRNLVPAQDEVQARAKAQFDDTAPTLPAEDAYADLRITGQRGLHVNLRNNAGAEVGISGAPVRTDPTGTTTQPVSDAGGALTVDAVDLDVRNLATGQDKVDVRLRNAADSAFIEPATDRATAAAPFSARLSDGAAFYDATKTGQLPTALVGGRLDVVVGAALPTGANNIGDVDVLTMPTGASAAQVQGTVAHDVGAGQNPVAVGAVAETPDDTAPANQVSAEGDVVRIAADRDGAVYTHPHPPRIWHVSTEYTTTQTDATVKAAPGAGLSLYITDIYLAVNAAVNVTLEEGTTVLKWKYYASGQGDGASVNFTTPIKITANTLISVTTSAAVTLTLVVTGYTAP